MSWDPEQYLRFQKERDQPFADLLAMLQPAPAPTVVDLGCGTGHLTAALHRRLQAESTLGLDSSAEMLAKAPRDVPGLTFQQADIADLSGTFDLVFSNAALQWLSDQESVFRQVATAVRPGGQLAVQVPANFDSPSHRCATRVAQLEPFRSALGGYRRDQTVLPPERYAELLFELGFQEQSVRLQVYPHVLEDRGQVFEWTRGTLLVPYRERLSAKDIELFCQAYQEELARACPDTRPFFFPFKRILLWGRRAGP